MVRKQLVTAAAIGIMALGLAARSGSASCPQIEPIYTIAGVTNGTKLSADQAFVAKNGCVTLDLKIVSQPGGTTDVTQDDDTRFFTDPAVGVFTAKNVWCANSTACGKDLTIYATFFDECSNTYLTATVHVDVAPCCPQLEPLFTITEVDNGTRNSPDQATVGSEGCVTLRLLIVPEPGSPVDVTFSPNTKFTTNPTQGFFSGNVWFVTDADCNKQFPIYAIYHDPCTGTNLVSTVHITVLPCTPE